MTDDQLSEALASFVATDRGNALSTDGTRIYAAPILGVAAADDPLFEQLREPAVVGPRHLLPSDWLPGARSVLSYFLPFSPAIRESNRCPGLPSRAWAQARIDGEAFNDAARLRLTGLIRELGEDALAPGLDPRLAVVDLRSNWSERHVAYVTGLGTFGLSRSLITRLGAAGRLGSVVTTLPLPPTRRPYSGPNAYCPSLSGGACEACVQRCPSGAVTPAGKDVPTCRRHLHDVVRPQFAPAYGCAKCQTGVPCEAGVP